ncbi:MAG: hypothetical protein K0R50_2857 [Eubacterium sp.]|jgi:hypothetical protein|nr:hypothetical protein [Eubacterium sp.]
MSDDKDNFEKQLFDCCLVMLSLLLKQYNNKIIDITDFKCHTTNKIRYILTNLDLEKDNEKKKVIENLIHDCNAINIQN